MWIAWVLLGVIVVLSLVVFYFCACLSGICSRAEERRELDRRLKDLCK